jgi:hypothetical protein
MSIDGVCGTARDVFERFAGVNRTATGGIEELIVGLMEHFAFVHPDHERRAMMAASIYTDSWSRSPVTQQQT